MMYFLVETWTPIKGPIIWMRQNVSHYKRKKNSHQHNKKKFPDMVRRNIPTFPRIEKALRAEASPLSTFYVLGPVFVLTGKILGSQEWLVCASFTKEIVFDPRTET